MKSLARRLMAAVHLRRRRLVRICAAALVVLALPAVSGGTWSGGSLHSTGPVGEGASASGDTMRRIAALKRQLAAQGPRGWSIVVDTYHNRLRVYRGDQTVRVAVCSTGTGRSLRDPRDGRIWVFDTPTGEWKVQRKVRNPVWVKPDWAFIEEGELPPNNPRERMDDVSLGDYGLYLGDGYIIHGTLFQSLLGQPATHGCVRLGDKDLEYVYKTVPVGSRVYLY